MLSRNVAIVHLCNNYNVLFTVTCFLNVTHLKDIRNRGFPGFWILGESLPIPNMGEMSTD